VYLGNKCVLEHELSSLSMSRLHGSGKLFKPGSGMNNTLSNLFQKVSSLKNMQN